MAEQEQPNQPEENEGESAPQQPAKKGFDTKFFLIALAVGIVMALISQAPLIGLGLFWFTKNGLQGNYSGNGYQGRFSSDVPEPYREIFTAAGSKFAVQPAFIAAIFYAGEHANSWPNAAGPWASSRRGAQGPFQFMPSTWNGYEQDGNNDGIMDPQNLWDSSFAASYYLSKLGAGGNTADPAKILIAAAKYNAGPSRPLGVILNFSETRNYVKRVTKAFIKFYESPDVGGDTNYIPGSGGWSWALANGKEDTACRAVHSCFMLRGLAYCASDLGAAEGLSSGSPVLAIGDGTITFQKASRHYGNDPYLYVRKNGHIAGYNAKFVSVDGKVEAFYAHIYRPKVAVQPIFTVKGGQQFATIYPWNKPDPDHENVYNSHLHFELRVNGYAITCGNQLDKIKEFQGGN